MPIYNFQCSNTECNHKSEKLMKMEDRNEPIECSKCGSTSIRVTSIPAPAQFKGLGWTEKFHTEK